MTELLSITLPLFGLIFLGFGAGKLRALPVDGLAWLNVFVIYLALPALFFQLLSKTPIEQLTNWGFVLATTLAAYTVFAISFGIGAVSTEGKIPESTIQGLAGAYGNIGYMGPGLALSALGPEAAVPVALIFCFENTMYFTLAPLLMAVSRKNGDGVLRLIWRVVTSIITHPFIIATILGIVAAAYQVRPPEPVERLLSTLSGAAAPCALFAIGVTIALRRVRRYPAVMPTLLMMKLVVHPVLAYVFVSWIGNFSPIWTYTAVLTASLPVATNVYVIAQDNDVWVDGASGAIVISTIVSVFTVTGLLYLVSTGMLPADLFP